MKDYGGGCLGFWTVGLLGGKLGGRYLCDQEIDQKDALGREDEDVAQAIRYAALYLPDQTVSLNSGHAVAA